MEQKWKIDQHEKSEIQKNWLLLLIFLQSDLQEVALIWTDEYFLEYITYEFIKHNSQMLLQNWTWLNIFATEAETENVRHWNLRYNFKYFWYGKVELFVRRKQRGNDLLREYSKSYQLQGGGKSYGLYRRLTFIEVRFAKVMRNTGKLLIHHIEWKMVAIIVVSIRHWKGARTQIK